MNEWLGQHKNRIMNCSLQTTNNKLTDQHWLDIRDIKIIIHQKGFKRLSNLAISPNYSKYSPCEAVCIRNALHVGLC